MVGCRRAAVGWPGCIAVTAGAPAPPPQLRTSTDTHSHCVELLALRARDQQQGAASDGGQVAAKGSKRLVGGLWVAAVVAATRRLKQCHFIGLHIMKTATASMRQPCETHLAQLQWQHTAPSGGRAATSARQCSTSACPSSFRLLGRLNFVMPFRASRGTSSLACWGEWGKTSCRQARGCAGAIRDMSAIQARNQSIVMSQKELNWHLHAAHPCCGSAARMRRCLGITPIPTSSRSPHTSRQPQSTAPASLATDPNPKQRANMQRLAAATRQLGLQLARGVEAGALQPAPARPPWRAAGLCWGPH